MTAGLGDPIREVLALAQEYGYVREDLLMQSITLCAGLCLLEGAPLSSPGEPLPGQEEFEDLVCRRLEGRDPEALDAFQTLSRVRLGSQAFDRLLRHWARFAGDRRKLLSLTERLIARFRVQGYRMRWEAPAWLRRLAVELLDPVEGVFYDGVAGTGSTALEAARYSAGRGGGLEVVAREADPLLFSLSVLRARIQGFFFRQTCENCLRTPLPVPPADFSIMLPPPGEGEATVLPDQTFCGSDWSFALHQLDALGETGRGVCLIPTGALFNAKNQTFRQRLVERNVIDAVISLPRRGAALPASATSLVLFRKGRRESDSVLFLELPEELLKGGLPDARVSAWLRDCRRLRRESPEKFPLPAHLDQGNLSPGQYLSAAPAGAASPGPECGGGPPEERVPLGEWAEIYRGINLAQAARDPEGTGVLRLADVQDGGILPEQAARYRFPPARKLDRYQVRPGDLLISCKGAAIKLCLVPELAEPLLLSHDFLGIRPNPDRVDPRYLLYLLRSPAGQRDLARLQMGSSIPMIRAADLERLPFLYIPLSQQRQCADRLEAAEQRVEAQIQALNRERERAYNQFYREIGLST